MQPPAPATDSLSATGAANYDRLRSEGLRRLQRLAGATWTDHNAHDPGITILEQLCYTLSDLGYRAGYSVPDLLADPAKPGAPSSLFPPAAILTANPVTLDDWRKLVLDIEGVRNAWVEPFDAPTPELLHDPGDHTLYFRPETGVGARAETHRSPVPLRGLYRVLVDADPDAGIPDPELRRTIDERLHAHRNLGEDFEPAFILEPQSIEIHAELELGDVPDPHELRATVDAVLQDYLAPRVPFHTLAEMLARGRSLDEIFNGPRLDHGFIDAEEMRQATRRSGLRVSDIIALLMGLEGIKAVHQIALGTSGRQEAWLLPLAPNTTPVLDISRSQIRFRRGRVLWSPPAPLRPVLKDTFSPGRDRPAPAPAAAQPAVPVGRDRQVERYRSFQNDLPETYGVGPVGLPPTAPAERHAQARQLAAYLMFFDQVLANGFSQLAHARDLFSFAPGSRPAYFAQLPADAPRGREVIAPTLDQARLETILQETTGTGAARTQRFLAHLLARFGEEFQDLMMVGLGSGGQIPEAQQAQRLEAQRAFLRDYPAVSGGRARAFDRTRPSWGEAHADNVSGLERRVARKIGLPTYYRRSLEALEETDPGGFHLIEHILLRPGKADRDQWLAQGEVGWRPPVFLASPATRDPYSAQLTFVFPGWIKAFEYRPAPEQPGEFARFIEKTVRDETPAHLGVRVLWFDRPAMAAFEAAYRPWLDTLAGIS